MFIYKRIMFLEIIKCNSAVEYTANKADMDKVKKITEKFHFGLFSSAK